MERIQLDIHRPTAEINRGNKFVAIGLGMYIMWPEAYALPDQGASTFAQAVMENFVFH